MGFVYKITNLVDGKLYIGMSERNDISLRWQEHIKQYQSARLLSKRPLYDAMAKYGIDNFKYEVIETTDNPKDREIYWIDKLRTYIGYKDCNGYNATLGGDSRKIALYNKEECDEIIKKFNNGESINSIARYTHHTAETISIFLKENGYITDNTVYKNIIRIDPESLDIVEYKNISEAALGIGKSANRIYEALHGDLYSAYGYFWMLNSDYENMSEDEFGFYIFEHNLHRKRRNKNPKSSDKKEPKIVYKRNCRVKCVESGQIFANTKEAAKWCNLASDSHIAECCLGKRKYSGRHPITNEKLTWEYVDTHIICA